MLQTHVIKKILLVDDNVLFLKMLSRAFEKAGFACTTCESAAAAIDYLRKETTDAILSDYQMPEMDGLEFRRYVLSQPALQNIPFIFLTNFSDQDVMTKGLDLQAVDYVLKDTPVNVIVSKLNNLIETFSKQRELSELEIKKAVSALNIKSVPQSAPQIKGYEINFWHQSFQDIPGGDFIDFITVTDRFSFIVLGDVMGKKWMAWFLSFSFLSYVRAAVRFGVLSEEYSPASILQKVNQIICYDEALKDILSSLSLLMIDHEANKVVYAGAGDLPVVHYNAKAKTVSTLNSSGLLLGLFPTATYDEIEVELEDGDQLFIFTDGMIDYSAGEETKTDYKKFVDRLQHIATPENSFIKLKDYILSQQAAAQVDDCSIIHLYKAPEKL
ncbi:fused response regulator/phosphatase [Mucilaginibacter sp. RS28]|uniref:Fused response regulator/phosphatase n=1 Tax=Mucilaginibacter straminoryzae TaxID=2932774 RepID=A0A9X2BEV7_9SPHI|nr:fused response regulator/phosphatase [Mucilaginibacter straminoryzae]MCJ8211833.1 fused response regulator/phosphatase [Mucilaginibacter straminoryzae]